MFKGFESSEHLLPSRHVEQVFRIKVLRPLLPAPHSEPLPVVYVTDSDEFYGGLATLAYELQLLSETPRFVLVAIGYEDEGASDLLRMRDLFDHASREHFRPLIEQLAKSPLGTGLSDPSLIFGTTDAGDFLRFIQEELKPHIEGHYSIKATESVLYGYSAGGTFGLYTLLRYPDTFAGGYILGSPATSRNGDHFGIALAEANIERTRGIQARVFVSVGELEELQLGLGEFDFVTGYYRLIKHLRAAAIPGLSLTTRMFPGETHATAWTFAFTHGLKTLLRPSGGGFRLFESQETLGRSDV